MKEVYQGCDSKTCKYENTVHFIIEDLVICSKCKKEYKINKVDGYKHKKTQ